jgi:transaldolase
VAEYAVSGATSTPTIFAKAIIGSDRYDNQLGAIVGEGIHDPREIFFALGLDDVRHAADLLRPVYDSTDGRDGFISFEWTPDLADDTAATIEQGGRPVVASRPARRDDQGAKSSTIRSSRRRCRTRRSSHA